MTTTRTSFRTIRARWAAIGAAVAVSLGAGGMGIVSAQIASGERPVTVTIQPRRILDTRFDIGLDGVFTADAPRDLQVTGDVEVAGANNSTLVGTVVPTGASGVLLNVTVITPTHFGHLSLRPAGATGVPTTANVNFAAGSVTPNAATIDLSTDGAIELWLVTASASGTAHVVVDVLGYTYDHNHDDRYPTTGAVAGALAAKADVNDVYTKTQVDALVPYDHDHDDRYPTAAAVAGALAAKANVDDVYTKTQVDALVPPEVELGIAAWSFVASESATISYTSGGCAYMSSDGGDEDARLFGTMALPVGVTVTRVSSAMIDSSQTDDATLDVWISDGNNGGTNQIGAVSTGGFPGFQRSWSQSLTPTEIGDGQFLYFEFETSTTAELQICGVQITYEKL